MCPPSPVTIYLRRTVGTPYPRSAGFDTDSKTISRSLKCYSTSESRKGKLDQYQILKYYSASESERNKFYQYQLRRFLVLSDPRRLPAVDGGLRDYT